MFVKRSLFILFFLQGCTQPYTAYLIDENLKHLHLSPKYHVQRSQAWAIPHSTRLAVASFTTQASRQEGFNAVGNTRLEPKRDFYTSVQFPRAYHQFQHILTNNLSAHFADVLLLSSLSIQDALNHALHQKADLLLLPSVVHYSDRVNTFDERRFNKLGQNKRVGSDTFTYKLTIYEVSSGRVIDTCLVHVKSAVFAQDSSDVDAHIKQSVESLINSIKL